MRRKIHVTLAEILGVAFIPAGLVSGVISLWVCGIILILCSLGHRWVDSRWHDAP